MQYLYYYDNIIENTVHKSNYTMEATSEINAIYNLPKDSILLLTYTLFLNKGNNLA